MRHAVRTDIEGLRAVAVLGVLAYHASLPFVPGGYVGVDVFFVISGFLITGMIHREVESTGSLNIAKFWAKRVKRLLPAAALVLLLTALLSAWLLPPIQRPDVARDVAANAFYVGNWWFAFQETDYLSAEMAPSPVLHFWSLCVEEQFYLFWPFVIWGLARFARKRKLTLRPVITVGLIAIAAVSFLWSLQLTTSNQPFAFFGTPARVWELALGGVIAVAAPALVKVSNIAVRALAGWAGLAMIIGSYFMFSTTTPFPGTAALWPVVGAALVIFSGLAPEDLGRRQGFAAGPITVLSVPFMRATGRYSYSLYLWHWPFVVFGAAILGRELSPFLGVVFTLLSVVPAYLSWRWVEEPFRASRAIVDRPIRAAVLATVCTVLVVITATMLLISGQSSAKVTVKSAAGVITINPAAARVDTAKPHHDGCFASKYAMTKAEPCVYGNPNGTRTVALLGDSHALMWFSAVEPIAINEGWRFEVWAKPSCTVADVDIHSNLLDRTYDECSTWRDSAVKALAKSKPDVLLVGTSRTYQVVQGDDILSFGASRQLMQDGLQRTYQKLEDTSGARVVVLADTPVSPKNIPTCLSAGNGSGCDFPATPAAERMDVEAAKRVSGVDVFDIVPAICPENECAAVSRGTILMLDGSHLTAAFVRTTQAELRPYLSS